MAIVGVRCTINQIRAFTDLGTPPKSQTSVVMTDDAGTFANTEFIAVDEAKREILAVALAAVSNNLSVFGSVDDPNGFLGNPSIYQLAMIVS
jgi:hypothetical protein